MDQALDSFDATAKSLAKKEWLELQSSQLHVNIENSFAFKTVMNNPDYIQSFVEKYKVFYSNSKKEKVTTGIKSLIIYNDWSIGNDVVHGGITPIFMIDLGLIMLSTNNPCSTIIPPESGSNCIHNYGYVIKQMKLKYIKGIKHAECYSIETKLISTSNDNHNYTVECTVKQVNNQQVVMTGILLYEYANLYECSYDGNSHLYLEKQFELQQNNCVKNLKQFIKDKIIEPLINDNIEYYYNNDSNTNILYWTWRDRSKITLIDKYQPMCMYDEMIVNPQNKLVDEFIYYVIDNNHNCNNNYKLARAIVLFNKMNTLSISNVTQETKLTNNNQKDDNKIGSQANININHSSSSTSTWYVHSGVMSSLVDTLLGRAVGIALNNFDLLFTKSSQIHFLKQLKCDIIYIIESYCEYDHMIMYENKRDPNDKYLRCLLKSICTVTDCIKGDVYVQGSAQFVRLITREELKKSPKQQSIAKL